MSLKITTWNINSVRLRVDLVERYLAQEAPDVLCLQEVKCKDSEFPSERFLASGYPYVAINGQKGYHGVAIISRRPFDSIDRRGFCGKGDSRHIAVRFQEASDTPSFVLHNFYVPAGGDEPDPDVNPKFAHKLAFFDEMRDCAKDMAPDGQRVVLVGDLNVAPLETDVWNHRAMLKVVSHTPIEVEKFTAAMLAGDWVDALRLHVPPALKLYTWWSYRSPNWEMADKGRRLDHIWVSPSLASASSGVQVLKGARGWNRPSDHVPVSMILS